MNSPLLDNLLAWSAEIAILVIAAAIAAYTLRHARARLYFWQAILAVAVLLPAIAPWKQPVTVALAIQEPAPLVNHGIVVPVPASTGWHIEPLLLLLVAGVALRMIWVAVGLLRLGRIRKRAQPLPQPPVAFAGGARWYVSDQVSGPVTFGWLRPSILLPARVR
jgi:hypothetical protein